MCAVRVVGPLNLGNPGMPSGHMTSPCVMTVPNSLQKVNEKPSEIIRYGTTLTLCDIKDPFHFLCQETSAHCVISAMMMMTMRAR